MEMKETTDFGTYNRHCESRQAHSHSFERTAPPLLNSRTLGVHDGLPPGVRPADNEAGWQDAFAKLAALVEAPHIQPME